MVGPTPSTSASCSSDAAMIASRLPNAVASARAAVGPTWRIDSATRIRHSGRSLALSQVGQQACAVGRQRAALGAEELGAQQVVGGEGEQVALVGDDPGVQQRGRRLVAQSLDVQAAAAGEVKHPLAQLRRAATGSSGSGCRRRPPWPARARCRIPGSGVGMTNSRSVPSRRSTTGPSTSGMTSPALRIITVSPISTPLRLTSEPLCRVAMPDRRPGDAHRRHHRERGDPAGAPDVDLDVEQLGLRLFGRVLVGDRPARRPRGGTEPALQGEIVDFDHHTVDFVLDLVAVLAPVADALPHRGQAGHPGGVVGDRQAPGLEREVGVVQGGRAEPFGVAQPVADHPQRAAGGHRRVLLPQRTRPRCCGDWRTAPCPPRRGWR